MTDFRGQLRTASACLKRSDARGCIRICDELLEIRPDLAEARHLRALAAIQSGDPQRALADLQMVWRAQPGNGHAAFWLGRLLRQAGHCQPALAPLQQAAQHPELEVDARYEMGRALTRLRRGVDAESQYRRVLERRPDHADAAANLAFLLERRNRLDEAAEWAGLAHALDAGGFMANLTLAVLDRRRGDLLAAQTRLEALLARETVPLNRSIALNQLGQCFERRNEWDAAFEHFAAANAILRAEHPHGRPDDTGSYGRLTLAALRAWLAAHPPSGWSANPLARADDPVFLVGFPRSGTTLLDQLLASHPGIEVCEEFEFFDTVRRDWVEAGRIGRLPEMTAGELSQARAAYLGALRAQRRLPERPIVVDKLPLSLAYLFLVHRLFPAARVILALRDPRDACLSCFFQSFDLKGAMPYFLDLGDTARYYDLVMGLAFDTLAQIPNPVLRLRYEDLVTDLPAAARAVTDFLGLAWREEMLDYRRQALERVIDTPSYQQVVEPLYRTSIGRWRNYRARMEPVLDILGPWVQRLGYAPD